MNRLTALVWLGVGAAVVVASGCASSSKVASGSANAASSTTVLSRDAFGQVQTQQTPAVDTQTPGWLAGLAEGDVLSYRLEDPDSHTRVIQVRVARLLRQAQSAAALLVPANGGNDSSMKPHWLAGDGDGLYELAAHEALLDPGFTPLDSNGRVIDSGRQGALWRVPKSWDEVVRHDQPTVAGGWAVEELDFTLDGPVRGDRCTRITRLSEQQRIRMTVCANIGMVDLEVGDDHAIGERWELIEIARVNNP